MNQYVEELISDLSSVREILDDIEKTLLVDFVNKEIPVEDRWTLFKFVIKNRIFVREGSHCSDMPGADYFPDFCPTEDIYLEKYETISMPAFYDRMIEFINDEENDFDFDEENDFDFDAETTLKEDILACGESAFEYNW